MKVGDLVRFNDEIGNPLYIGIIVRETEVKINQHRGKVYFSVYWINDSKTIDWYVNLTPF